MSTPISGEAFIPQQSPSLGSGETPKPATSPASTESAADIMKHSAINHKASTPLQHVHISGRVTDEIGPAKAEEMLKNINKGLIIATKSAKIMGRDPLSVPVEVPQISKSVSKQVKEFKNLASKLESGILRKLFQKGPDRYTNLVEQPLKNYIDALNTGKNIPEARLKLRNAIGEYKNATSHEVRKGLGLTRDAELSKLEQQITNDAIEEAQNESLHETAEKNAHTALENFRGLGELASKAKVATWTEEFGEKDPVVVRSEIFSKFAINAGPKKMFESEAGRELLRLTMKARQDDNNFQMLALTDSYKKLTSEKSLTDLEKTQLKVVLADLKAQTSSLIKTSANNPLAAKEDIAHLTKMASLLEDLNSPGLTKEEQAANIRTLLTEMFISPEGAKQLNLDNDAIKKAKDVATMDDATFKKELDKYTPKLISMIQSNFFKAGRDFEQYSGTAFKNLSEVDQMNLLRDLTPKTEPE